MFRRTFWFTAGAAAGVWATTKVNRKLRQLTPESLAAQAADKALDAGARVGLRVREFAVDVRTGMVRRESELGAALGLDAPADPALPAPRRRAAIEYAERLRPSGRLPAAGTPRTGDTSRTDEHPRTAHSYDPYDRNEDH
ncbi:hypothetical protein [Streptomyces sp. NRRL F-5135]|uniref:hypothetical protein n=1 Tax=Streptomyces sp. NRRL F-5135 TaxID=1463858 RepID=UPI0004C5AC6E|nr:hypothetical protein [Streptomyces sp. NRRL F-5135]